MARTLDHVTAGCISVSAPGGSSVTTPSTATSSVPRRTVCAARTRPPADEARLAALDPSAVGDLPILIGGGGEKVTLRLVAEYADAWNTFGPPANFARKSAILDQWWAKLGRDPSSIERTVAVIPATSTTLGGTSRAERPT